MTLHDTLSEFLEIMTLLDSIEARQIAVQDQIEAVAALPLSHRERTAQLTKLGEEHETLNVLIEQAIARIAVF